MLLISLVAILTPHLENLCRNQQLDTRHRLCQQINHSPSQRIVARDSLHSSLYYLVARHDISRRYYD